jgi:hypothetical protein
MTTQTYKRGTAIFAGLMLLIGIVAGSAVTANAQRYGRNWDGYPNWGGNSELRQTALNAGYNEGNREGSNVRSNGRFTSNFNDFSSYRNASKDYKSRFGDRALYQRYFRLAFENGFSDATGTSAGSGGYNNGGYNNGGYNNGNWDPNRDRDRDRDRDRNRNRSRYGRNWDGYPNWGGSYDLRQTAMNARYNECNKEGRSDSSRGRASNYSNFSSYRNATTDYNNRLGDRELYRRYFREAFQNGYEDGYSGY